MCTPDLDGCRRVGRGASVGAGLALQAHPAFIPNAPGSGADGAARLIATQLGRALGQTRIVDSRPGGNTTIADIAVARLNALRSPFRSAEILWVDEIDDPRRSRALLVELVRLAEPLRTPGRASFQMRP